MASSIEKEEITLWIYEYVKMNPTIMYKYNTIRYFKISAHEKKKTCEVEISCSVQTTYC